MEKAALAPLVKDMHTEIGSSKSITEGQLRAILFVTAVWHGLDLYLSPYPFEFQVHMCLHAMLSVVTSITLHHA